MANRKSETDAASGRRLIPRMKPIRKPVEAVAAIARGMAAFPDLRVCQLIVNATGRNDPFYVEDDLLIICIDRFVKEHGPQSSGS